MLLLRRKALHLLPKNTLFTMKGLIYCFCAVLILASCRGGKKTEVTVEDNDSLAVAPDSSETDSLPAPSKAADGLFDDFIYSFMCNSRFQRERIQFPLVNMIDGVNHPIAKVSWKFDPLYRKKDVYTIIFDNARSIKAEKDTSLRQTTVEWVYLNTHRVKQYKFEKKEGQWMLVEINQHDLSENINSDFYEFYRQFSSNKRFQKRHISNPFQFKTYDFDNFKNIEGLLDVEQWPDYRPELPTGTITNINYGQSYGDARRRVLMICSQSGGMGCSLTFVRKGKTWILERLEN